MQRTPITPRSDWQKQVEAKGLLFHTLEDGTPYWDESAAYHFSAAEIDTLEAAGNELQTMCLAAAQHIIDNKRYAELDIPTQAIPAIEWAWNAEPPALYGRFDISWAGTSSGQTPKLLEYNADTPTSLLEAAVIQWSWLEEVGPQLASHSFLPFTAKPDQFNSIHDRLIAKWKDVAPYLSEPLYFAGLDNPEDQLTLTYLRDTAQQAGLETLQMFMEEIGWNDEQQAFMDPNEDPMRSIFKLYPWEAMLAEEFGPHALTSYQSATAAVSWIEPIWKTLLSNKGILPILWQLYPNHELLLEAHFENPGNMRNYVRKPLLSREGANITVVRDNATVAATEGTYHGRQIYQALAPEAVFQTAAGASKYPVLGLWMVDQECSGLGIRESSGLITDNLSSFVPHFFL
ncbi:MAG: glutathionylspermidine synthase [Acidobacteriaceae bacterium]|nr:glutathionylspermidine synthase [Acidobacteriaceae bacterium]